MNIGFGIIYQGWEDGLMTQMKNTGILVKKFKLIMTTDVQIEAT
jgi:hypothetical protein